MPRLKSKYKQYPKTLNKKIKKIDKHHNCILKDQKTFRNFLKIKKKEEIKTIFFNFFPPQNKQKKKKYFDNNEFS